MVFIRYLGHSSFHVQLAGRDLYFDPWLNPRPKEMQRLVPPAFTQESVKKADVILLSHEHFDHCDPYDVDSIVERTHAHVVAPPEAMARLHIPPRAETKVNEGDAFNLLGLDIQVVEARHPQSEHSVGFIVSGEEGKRLYFAGDTYDFYGMTDFDVDIAFLPIGGTYTMDDFSAIKALKQMRTKYVIPMHYDTFDKIRVDLRDFVSRVKSGTKAQPVVLKVGEAVNL